MLATPSAPAAPVQPAGAPDDYVATPNGYFHRSCVHRIEPGEIVEADGALRRADGARRRFAPCAYAHFAGPGIAQAPGSAPPAVPSYEIQGYVTYAWFTRPPSDPAGAFTANMTVPEPPVEDTGQIVYLFPGLLDYQNEQTILQPVLGWNQAYGPPGWSIASWNCCVDGNENYSPHVSVSPGDAIAGAMSGSNCTGAVCTDWEIRTTDVTTQQSTTLDTQGGGQVFDWIVGGALEVYGVSDCQQQPASGVERFTDAALSDLDGTPLALSNWHTYFADFVDDDLYASGFDSGHDAYCRYAVEFSSDRSEVAIGWSPE